MPIILHLCCADCLLRYLVSLNYDLPPTCHNFFQLDYQKSTRTSPIKIDFHLFFYNPNIYPKSEYNARLQAVKKIAQLLNLPLTIADYQPQDYFNLPTCQTQLSTFNFSTNRCYECQNLRLAHTLQFAKDTFATDHFSTTMLASHYLNQSQIIDLGQKLSPSFYLPKFCYPFLHIKTSGFFKQNYCGCLFSLNQKTKEKYLNQI